MSDRFAALRNLPRLHITAPRVNEQPANPTAKATKPPKCKPNDTCVCGSHKKYKKCCMNKDMNQARADNPLLKMQEMMRSNKELTSTVRQLADSLKKA